MTQFEQARTHYISLHGEAYVWEVESGAVTLHLPRRLTPDEANNLAARIGRLLVLAAQEPPYGEPPPFERDNVTCPHGLHFGGHYCEECNP